MATLSFLLLYKGSVSYKVNPLASSPFKAHSFRNAESTQVNRQAVYHRYLRKILPSSPERREQFMMMDRKYFYFICS